MTKGRNRGGWGVGVGVEEMQGNLKLHILKIVFKKEGLLKENSQVLLDIN